MDYFNLYPHIFNYLNQNFIIDFIKTIKFHFNY